MHPTGIATPPSAVRTEVSNHGQAPATRAIAPALPPAVRGTEVSGHAQAPAIRAIVPTPTHAVRRVEVSDHAPAAGAVVPAPSSAVCRAEQLRAARAFIASTVARRTVIAERQPGARAIVSAPNAAACRADDSDQQQVARAFVSAAIRLAPVLPLPPERDRSSVYIGRHRRSVAGALCPTSRQAGRP